MSKNAKMTNPMKVITGPNTRWSYANVWEPKSINGGTPKYRVSLIIPKSDSKTVAKIEAAIEAAYREGESKLKGKSSQASESQETEDSSDSGESSAVNLIRQYTFTHLDDVIAASHGLNGFFTGENSLYKIPGNGSYQLIIHQSSHTAQEFNKVCNILSEYGKGRACTPAGEAHLIEHGELISTNVLQQLIQL